MNNPIVIALIGALAALAIWELFLKKMVTGLAAKMGFDFDDN